MPRRLIFVRGENFCSFRHETIRCLVLAASTACLLLASNLDAHGTVFILSETSSEPITSPAGDLDARLEFNVSGATLTLSAFNLTDATGHAPYDIGEIYFNTTDDITGLSLINATHSVEGDVTGFWPLFADGGGNGGPTKADGFGVFDYALLDGVGGALSKLGPSERIVFVLEINGGVGTYDDEDFIDVSRLSSPTRDPQMVAAKFNSGPGDDFSAFGATASVIPEPATLCLLAVGLIGALRRHCAWNCGRPARSTGHRRP